MRIYETAASLRHWRPIIGVLPWMLLGMLATVGAALFMAGFPWLPVAARSGTPVLIQAALVIIGALMLVFLVPAQMRALLRETAGRYTVDADEGGLTIRYAYWGGRGSKHFPWKEIAAIGLVRAGLPPCDAIRIDPREGYWFSFGAFFDPRTRQEILHGIYAAGAAIRGHQSTNAA